MERGINGMVGGRGKQRQMEDTIKKGEKAGADNYCKQYCREWQKLEMTTQIEWDEDDNDRICR